MSTLFFLATLCLGVVSAIPMHDPSLDAEWQKWKTRHGKTYNMHEEGQKRAVWEDNRKVIELHNEGYAKGVHDFSMEMNAFGDLYVKDNRGLDARASYAYEARKGPCRYDPKSSAANVTGYVKIPVSEAALMNAVATVGPVSVGIDSHHYSFRFYSGGKCSSFQ
ncbi:Testin-2 [Microtus ochrogaster]|uniref:Testin-2 n=1 Tax=Microtus ochrogaster TaxID=79684 RepID=A0A8J6G759_MICOH|nr:Testin-2 [Microtus ochrogaster]